MNTSEDAFRFSCDKASVSLNGDRMTLRAGSATFDLPRASEMEMEVGELEVITDEAFGIAVEDETPVVEVGDTVMTLSNDVSFKLTRPAKKGRTPEPGSS